MPNAAYDLFVDSMIEERQVACVFKGRVRVFSVILPGHTDGEERALAWQTAGESSEALPGWRSVTLAEVANVRLVESRSQRGTRRKGQQSWVADVDLDVNPESPYHPRRRLDDLRRARKPR